MSWFNYGQIITCILAFVSSVGGTSNHRLPPNNLIDNRIIPGSVWKDTDGNPIQAHGAGMIKVGRQWFWFGEDKGANNQGFRGISCYVSCNLATWKRLPNVLTPVSGTSLDSCKVVERPKVIYNFKTRLYVMYFHCDSPDYRLAQVGVATSQHLTHGWKFQRNYSPLNSESRDMSLFQDDDKEQTAYLSFASDGNRSLKIARLSPDYLDAVELTYKWEPVRWEATGIVKQNGVYTMIFSRQDGWNPSDHSSVQTRNLKGPWSTPKLIGPPNFKAHCSQNAYEIVVKGTKQTTVIYAGDRWIANELGASKYVWLPLKIVGTKVEMIQADVWSIDTTTGEVIIKAGEEYKVDQIRRYLYTHALKNKGASLATFKNVRAPTHEREPLCHIYYRSPGTTYKIGNLSVNKQPKTEVEFPPSMAVLSIPIIVKFDEPTNNRIHIEVPSGVTIEQIKIY